MFIIEVPNFNLNHIYDSGQVPRWIKIKDSNYIVLFKDKALKIGQKKNRLVLNCSEEEFYDIWFNYFDLKVDYLDENSKVKRLGGKFKIPSIRGNGIHLVKQEFFESYVFCKLVGFVGYKKASELMNRIARDYGIKHKQSMKEAGKVTWFEWPSPEMMLEKLNKKKTGLDKVDRFLKKLCNAIVEEEFAYTHSDNELFRLFGKHDMTAFPLEGIEEVLSKNFNCEPDEFAEWYLDGVENKGLVYLYILHHIKNPPREVVISGVN